jgi:uncharacterized protein YcbX
MSGHVAEIWRHPIKSHSRERVGRVTLSAGRTMPGDRVWAVAHDSSPATSEAWSRSAAFSIGTRAPQLQAVRGSWDEAAGLVTLTHPGRPELRFDPDVEPERLIEWVAPLMPPGRAQPVRLVRVPGRGMTDTDYPSVSLMNLASHRAVEARMGRRLSPLRWRGNFLVDDVEPWAELGWVGGQVRIGEALLTVRERCKRCLSTAANPDTGLRDADTLGTLQEGWDHTDFGLYAEVTEGGVVAEGDRVERVA